MNVTTLFVGSSLLGSLRQAEREINRRHRLDLRIACHNCTLPLSEAEWSLAESDLATADIVFVLHVTDQENSVRICAALDRFHERHRAVVVINCLADLMTRTRLGESSWLASYARAGRASQSPRRPERALKLLRKVPALLRFVPSKGRLGELKHYLNLFCYFLQPTPANIRSMVLYAIKHALPERGKALKIDAPESRAVTGIYHPDAPAVFESFAKYRRWYAGRLDPKETLGLLLLRPQVVSGACAHYDYLIRSIEREGLSVIPILSTFMDNREACREFLAGRVSQILSLTGFSFVGGPAMNDSGTAVEFLKSSNCALRSAVSLETQRTENWAESMIGLNPVQTAMQIAIPEIDGATEPFVFGGIPVGRDRPEPIEERCRRLARRLARWNRLQRLPRPDVRVALILYCFPPNKGNLGTAAELDAFPSLWNILRRLREEGYELDVPPTADELREALLQGDDVANVAYRLSTDEYFRLCPYVEEIEAEWGPAPGRINARGRDILIHGIRTGNIFIGVQPTFGYEGDPMRLLMAKGGAPHHGFMGLYTYLEHVFHADALIHVGTHGALEFMPGKQAGLSGNCWPDRLIGEFPNIYIYSVNNPSEGSIAKRRSYAELISYLTPPVENAGLYKDLAALKELVAAYRQAREEGQREKLFSAIQAQAEALNLST